MSDSLHVLMVEDSEDDALLILRELRRNGFNVIWERVETAEALRLALQNQHWDVILSDYNLPGFNAPMALEIVQQSRLNLPFIVVSGTIGETSAVELMKAGAHDYLMKGNLTRLPEAIRRELREAQVRLERQQAKAVLDQTKERLQLALEGSGIGLWDWSVPTGVVTLNDRWAEMIGYSLSELEPISIQTWRHYTHPDDLQKATVALEQHFRQVTQVYECELRMRHKLGMWVWVLARGKVVEWDAAGTPLRMTGTHLDINDRKQAELRLALQHSVLERIARAQPLPEILELLVCGAEEQLDGGLCSVLL
jgi:PAS domain S-box-containing protein